MHILTALALVLIAYRTDPVDPSLAGALEAAFPDVDICLFYHVIVDDDGFAFGHRGITHSLFAAVAFTAVASVFYRRAAALAYASHLALDFVTGVIRLFAPLGVGRYGVHRDWFAVNVAASAVTIPLLLGGLIWLSDDVVALDRAASLRNRPARGGS